MPIVALERADARSSGYASYGSLFWDVDDVQRKAALNRFFDRGLWNNKSRLDRLLARRCSELPETAETDLGADLSECAQSYCKHIPWPGSSREGMKMASKILGCIDD